MFLIHNMHKHGKYVVCHYISWKNNDTSDICLYDYHHMRKNTIYKCWVEHGATLSWLTWGMCIGHSPQKDTLYTIQPNKELSVPGTHWIDIYIYNIIYIYIYILGKQSTGNHGFLASHIEVSYSKKGKPIQRRYACAAPSRCQGKVAPASSSHTN